MSVQLPPSFPTSLPTSQPKFGMAQYRVILPAVETAAPKFNVKQPIKTLWGLFNRAKGRYTPQRQLGLVASMFNEGRVAVIPDSTLYVAVEMPPPQARIVQELVTSRTEHVIQTAHKRVIEAVESARATLTDTAAKLREAVTGIEGTPNPEEARNQVTLANAQEQAAGILEGAIKRHLEQFNGNPYNPNLYPNADLEAPSLTTLLQTVRGEQGKETRTSVNLVPHPPQHRGGLAIESVSSVPDDLTGILNGKPATLTRDPQSNDIILHTEEDAERARTLHNPKNGPLMSINA